jgi:hypothetical protein
MPKGMVIIALLTLFSPSVFGQQETVPLTEAEKENAQNLAKWLNEMYEHGIRQDADTLFISAEVQNLLSNPEMMAFMFPQEYTWGHAIALMEKMELKKAFWFLLNLYPENRELVVQTLLKYDSLVEMDKVLTSVFYTYAMIDPSVCKIENGKPQIIRPDLVEEGLSNLKEMIQYIRYYRARNEEEKQ